VLVSQWKCEEVECQGNTPTLAVGGKSSDPINLDAVRSEKKTKIKFAYGIFLSSCTFEHYKNNNKKGKDMQK